MYVVLYCDEFIIFCEKCQYPGIKTGHFPYSCLLRLVFSARPTDASPYRPFVGDYCESRLNGDFPYALLLGLAFCVSCTNSSYCGSFS